MEYTVPEELGGWGQSGKGFAILWGKRCLLFPWMEKGY